MQVLVDPKTRDMKESVQPTGFINRFCAFLLIRGGFLADDDTLVDKNGERSIDGMEDIINRQNDVWCGVRILCPSV